MPRDPNPFQDRLYAGVQARGARVAYLDGPSPSHTVNLLCMPFVLMLRRLQGFGVLHVHWTFGFVPAWARRRTVMRRLCRGWFVTVLRLADAIGYQVVWTAHNVLPHAPVFDNDVAARRALVKRCSAIVAMNTAAMAGVQTFGPRCEVVLIPHGADSGRPDRLSGHAADRRSGTTFAFFGRIESYKGVPDLLHAFAGAAFDAPPTLLIAGRCADPALESEIRRGADRSPADVRLRLRELTDPELEELLDEADVVVLPFRAISTSGSVLTAMRSSAPVVVPHLPAFADIPERALIRYSGGTPGLRAILEGIPHMDRATRADIVGAAHRYLEENTWDRVAARHVELFAATGRGGGR